MMATREKTLGTGNPDSSGSVYPDTFDNVFTMTNSKDTLEGMVIAAPGGSGDVGVWIEFTVPADYVSTPTLLIRGYVAEAANTLGWGATALPIADTEAVDQAQGSEATTTESTWTGYAAEDYIELSITLSGTFAASDRVLVNVYREDGNDNQTGDFLLTELAFQYSDA